MAPKHSSSTSSSSADESSDDEVTAPSPPPKTTTAPKKANGSSTVPKPSSTSTQVPKPKPSTAAAAAQGPKSKPSSNPPKPTSSEDDGSDSDSGEDEDDKKEVKADNEEEESSDGNDSDSGKAKDDNEEEEEESSDGSDSESGENRINPPPQQQQPPLKPTTTEASADGSTDDSGSESSDQPPPSPRRSSRVADPSIKPITTKPMDVTSIPASNQDSKTPNKKKQKVPEASENQSGGQKRQLFQRIWSEEDEISILHGMVDYHAKKGTLPSSTDMDAFYDFIQKSLQMEVSKAQLADKVRRLKKKYDTAAARSKNGVDPSFTKPHERTAYDISKKIWGPKRVLSKDAEIDGNIARKRQKIKEEQSTLTSDAMITNEDDDSVTVKSPYPLLRKAVLQMTNGQCSSSVAKRALELVDDGKAMALEKRYHKLKLSEMKQYMHRMDLTKEIVKMTISAIEKLG